MAANCLSKATGILETKNWYFQYLQCISEKTWSNGAKKRRRTL